MSHKIANPCHFPLKRTDAPSGEAAAAGLRGSQTKSSGSAQVTRSQPATHLQPVGATRITFLAPHCPPLQRSQRSPPAAPVPSLNWRAEKSGEASWGRPGPQALWCQVGKLRLRQTRDSLTVSWRLSVAQELRRGRPSTSSRMTGFVWGDRSWPPSPPSPPLTLSADSGAPVALACGYTPPCLSGAGQLSPGVALPAPRCLLSSPPQVQAGRRADAQLEALRLGARGKRLSDPDTQAQGRPR